MLVQQTEIINDFSNIYHTVICYLHLWNKFKIYTEILHGGTIATWLPEDHQTDNGAVLRKL